MYIVSEQVINSCILYVLEKCLNYIFRFLKEKYLIAVLVGIFLLYYNFKLFISEKINI